MKNYYLPALLAGFALFLLSNCQTEECFTPPEIFRLKMSNSKGVDVLNPAHSDSLRLTVVLSDREEILDLAVLVDSSAGADLKIYFLESGYAAWKSAEGYKTFKLYRGASMVDTILLDVQEEHTKKCTFFQVNRVLFNGQDVQSTRDHSVGAYQIVTP